MSTASIFRKIEIDVNDFCNSIQEQEKDNKKYKWQEAEEMPKAGANIVKNIEILKSFGFQFKCKPKKSLEEVLSKYQETEFVFGEDNYFIATNKNQEFCYDYENEWKPIGTKYYSQEDCDKILDELNG